MIDEIEAFEARIAADIAERRRRVEAGEIVTKTVYVTRIEVTDRRGQVYDVYLQHAPARLAWRGRDVDAYRRWLKRKVGRRTKGSAVHDLGACVVACEPLS